MSKLLQEYGQPNQREAVNGIFPRPDIAYVDAGRMHVVEIKVTGGPLATMEAEVFRDYRGQDATIHPFVVSTAGALAPRAKGLLKRLQATPDDLHAMSVSLVRWNAKVTAAFIDRVQEREWRHEGDGVHRV